MTKAKIKVVQRGITGRKHHRKELGHVQFVRKHIMLEAVAHQEGGIFYLREDDGGDGRLCAVVEVEGVGRTGMSDENLIFNSRRLAAVLDKMPENMTLHAWQDVTPERGESLPEDYHNAYLNECERELNRMLGQQLQWRTKSYICLEWKGSFAQGGEISKAQALKSGVESVEAKLKGERRRSERAQYRFLSLFQSSKRLIRIYGDLFKDEVLRFNDAINGFIAALTSQTHGIGAYASMKSIVDQLGAPPKVPVKVRRLNGREGMRAVYGLGDPSPVNRENWDYTRITDLGSQLGREDLDFNWLITVASGESSKVSLQELREVAEHGPYTIGGMARQIFAVRLLPGHGLPYDLFSALRKAGVPFTVRVRWSRLTKHASDAWIKRNLSEKKWSGPEMMDMVMAEVEADRLKESEAAGYYGIGLGSILIAINGVPHRDGQGRLKSSTEVLMDGIRAVQKFSRDHDIQINTLARPALQKTAHFAMYPGSFHLDPLEQIPIRAMTLGKLLPIYRTSPEAPRNSSDPGIPIMVMEDAAGELNLRSLEVGAIGLGTVIGSTGSGKSYLLNTIARNFLKNEGRASQGKPRQNTLDLFEFGDGTDDGSSFNSLVRLLGGKVIQFSNKAHFTDIINPFDMEVEPGAGYSGDDILMLEGLLVSMGGGDVESGGRVTQEHRAAFREALKMLGKIPEGELTNKVRCLQNLYRYLENREAKGILKDWVDPQGLGAYFPMEKDSTRSQIVNYNFTLTMNPLIRSVMFGAVLARLNRRMYTGPKTVKLLIGDEIGAGLKRGDTPKDEAVIESARRQLSALFANVRRFNGRALLAFQRPSQITEMGPTLKGVIRANCSTHFLYEITEEVEAKELLNLTDAAYKAVRNLDPERREVALLQAGQVTIERVLNPLLGHAGNTTDPKERRLRDAMVATGRWGDGAAVDVLGVVRAFVPHLEDLRHIRDDQDKTEYVNRMIEERYSRRVSFEERASASLVGAN